MSKFDETTTLELLEELKRRSDHLIVGGMLVDTEDGKNGDMRIFVIYKGNAHVCAGLAFDAAESVLQNNRAIRQPSEL
jgi:hypothetical protein